MLKRLALVAVALIALSLGFGSAAFGATGQLYSFGYNVRGQLGSPVNVGTFNPVPTAVSVPGATGPVTQVAAGIRHSLVATSTGQLFSFGSNEDGQLGITAGFETNAPNPTPTPVSLFGATGPVTDVAASVGFSLALTSTGQLYGFGDNYYGQLGTSANNQQFVGNSFPALAPVPGPVARVAVGYGFTLAVTSGGQLYAFGSNKWGQLTGTTNNESDKASPKPALVTLPGATGPVSQVAAGNGHSLVLTSTGQLYAFGRNINGELGLPVNNGTEAPNPTPALVTLPGASGPIAEIAAGYEHSLVLTSTGQVYTFGRNYDGQLGRAANSGTSTPNPTPTLVSLPGATGQATHVAAGQDYSLVLTSTGQIFAFGDNEYGQLGNTTNIETFNPNPTPTLVPLAIPAGMGIADFTEGSGAKHVLIPLVDPSSPAPAPSRSRATAAKTALVKNGKALVSLSCPGPATCAGKLELKAKLKPKKKAARASAKPKRQKAVKIGSASFSIAAGKKRTIAVALKSKAVARIKAAGKAGLRAQLTGSGVKAGSLLLKAAPKKRSK